MTTALPLFDHHAHLDDPAVDAPLLRAGLDLPQLVGAISAGYGPERDALAMTRMTLDSRLFRTVGLHPWWLAEQPEAEREARWREGWATLEQRVAHLNGPAPDATSRIVGLGEIGLDQTLRKRLPLSDQLKHFERGLDLARQVRLPVVLHLVRWHGHALSTLRDLRPINGVVHRYGGPPDLVADFQRLGLSLSLHPSRWRRDPRSFHAVVRAIEPAHLLVETDWPQGTQSWAEALLEMTACITAIANIRKIHPNALAEELVANARRVYGITR